MFVASSHQAGMEPRIGKHGLTGDKQRGVSHRHVRRWRKFERQWKVVEESLGRKAGMQAGSLIMMGSESSRPAIGVLTSTDRKRNRQAARREVRYRVGSVRVEQSLDAPKGVRNVAEERVAAVGGLISQTSFAAELEGVSVANTVRSRRVRLLARTGHGRG